MKKTLIALALGALFASCGQDGAEVAKLQKQVDSLTAIFNKRQNKTNVIDKTHGSTAITMPFLPMADYFMRWDTASKMIKKWREFQLIPPTLRSQRAFMLPASNLLHLVSPDSQANNAVIFYLGLDSAGMITLLYEGGNVTSVQGPLGLDTMFFEQPVYVDTDRTDPNAVIHRPQIFNHAYPCPTCDIVSTFNSANHQ